MAKNEDYERCLYHALHRFCRQIDEGDLTQSFDLSHEDLVCFAYLWLENWFENCMDQFRSLLGLQFFARERQDPSKVLLAGVMWKYLPFRRLVV